MNPDAERRAELRRMSWMGGIANMEQAADLDVQFWSAATGEQRLEAVWQMAVESLIMKGDHGTRAGLQGSLAGVRRR